APPPPSPPQISVPSSTMPRTTPPPPPPPAAPPRAPSLSPAASPAVTIRREESAPDVPFLDASDLEVADAPVAGLPPRASLRRKVVPLVLLAVAVLGSIAALLNYRDQQDRLAEEL